MDLAKYAGTKIKYFREQRNWTQTDLAKQLGIGKSAIANYEAGTRQPKQDVLFSLSKVFHVSINEFFPYPDNVKPITTGIRRIPVLGAIACGDPITADENIEGYRETIADLLPSGTVFYLKAKGQSMEPTIPNGSYVLIREQPTVEDGEIAAVLVDNDNEATLKRIKHQGDIVMLMPDNHEYDPIILSDDYTGRIIGKAMRFVADL
ncbi:LexA family transcriptional regulator [Ligilactobacillus pabuli]|uniref:LexA family transcriptional regulator n=1 Tax=Ligilactobacillus pabuli TaxID=2886039 RepID=A0ABQ5JI01_9LACO|nr:XRE family transcriptional regulator [Ligilactobacillus pabuli]GKS80695.1 LexA family transcriptional regulator [Ligilactobacillus pabuli]